MDKDKKVYIAGHAGMVGSALLRKFQKEGFTKFILRRSSDLDLRDSAQVAQFFLETKPDYVLVAAAKVGGIHANNSYRASFLYDNLMIASNVIHQSYVYGVDKLLFLGSTCIYPKFARQPIKEADLLSGYLESTNEPYAIAKIAGVKLCETYRSQYGCNYIAAMPTNLYGEQDNFDLQTSHVLPALLRKFHQAKMAGHTDVTIWGDGTPMREFLHVDDLADACYFLMEKYNDASWINVGYGEDCTIIDLAKLIQRIVGHQGTISVDNTKPNGTLRKLVDSTRLRSLGWKPSISLEEGIKQTYAWCMKSVF